MNRILRLWTFFLLSVFSFSQQDFYWVGDGGNWDSYSTHWATSTGGTTFHTSAPTKLDNVYFDANSFFDYNKIHDSFQIRVVLDKSQDKSQDKNLWNDFYSRDTYKEMRKYDNFLK